MEEMYMELYLDHISKKYKDKVAVDDVSLRLTPGVWGLLGANSEGKTTLMRMIAGIMRPTAGQVKYDGLPITELKEKYRDRFGYLPQDFGYYPDFTALDFMLYLAALKGINRRAARCRSLELLETVGLADVARAKVRTFSGGMKQRLGIAQAVLNDPAVLVLDEPTAGLDPKERVRFRNLIASFAQDKIVVLSTHIVSDVEYVADEILVMRAGSFVLEGSPEQVVAQVAGKVWECAVGPREADSLTARCTVGNAHYGADGQVVLRIVADERPHAQARPLEPTLEDVYLYLFREGPAPDHADETAQTRAAGKGGRHA